METDNTFILDENGESKECLVITTLYSETRKKHYVVYCYLDDEEQFFVSSFDPTDTNGDLEDVSDDEELKEIVAFLEMYGGTDEKGL